MFLMNKLAGVSASQLLTPADKERFDQEGET